MPMRSFEEIIKSVKSRVSNLDTSEGSYTDTLVRSVCMELAQGYFDLDSITPIAFVDETSGGYIDMRAGEYGLTRKPGTNATATVHFVGAEGKQLPAGTAVQTQDGLVFLTDETVSVVAGTAQARVTAAEVGTQYNVAAGAITALQSSAGVTVTGSAAAVGGADAETDTALLDRLLLRLQKPPTSGNAYQYEQWSLEVAGIGGARVYPLWAGPGTCKVVVVNSEMVPPTAEQVALVAAHIEAERPICVAVHVEAAVQTPLNVAAVVVLDGSSTQEAVKQQFTQALRQYCRDLAFRNLTVVYNRIAYMLLSIPGVRDFSELTVNGAAANITLADNAVPTVGSVVIT